MIKRIVVIALLIALIAILYIFQFNSISDSEMDSVSGYNLDLLQVDKADEQWEPFYKVRATIIDGQHAKMHIPKTIRQMQGNTIELSGACMFFGNGCKRQGDSVTISEFYLVPTTGIAESCVVLPDREMSWKVKTMLSEPYKIYYEDMIGMEVKVNGEFQIDESNPYDAVFFIKNGEMEPLNLH